MKVHLKVWRQAGPGQAGKLVDYNADNVTNSQDFFDFLADFFVGC